MEDIANSLVPGVAFIVLGLWWLVGPLHKFFKTKQKHLNHKPSEQYVSDSSYNLDCCSKVPEEGLLKIAGGLTCVVASILQRHNHDRPSHYALYIGYAISGAVDIIKVNTNILSQGAGYISLVMAHILEVLLLHLQQSSEIKVKVGELPYVGNDTHLIGGITEIDMNSKFQYYIGQSTIESYTEFIMSLTILSVCVILIIEMKFPHVIGFAVTRAVLCLVHGSWLCQTGGLLRNIDHYDPVGSYSTLINVTYLAHVSGAVIVAGIVSILYYVIYLKNCRLYSAFRSVPTDYHI